MRAIRTGRPLRQ